MRSINGSVIDKIHSLLINSVNAYLHHLPPAELSNNISINHINLIHLKLDDSAGVINNINYSQN